MRNATVEQPPISLVAYTKTTGGWFAQCSGVSANLNAWANHIAVTRGSTNATRIFVDGTEEHDDGTAALQPAPARRVARLPMR
jgi:hypothetical protein